MHPVPDRNWPARFAWALAFILLHLASVRTQAEVLITEFMADNRTALADEDGDFSDWVELHNPDATAVDLSGWFLTDDAARLNRWSFPAVSLAPGQYLVVFASGKNRRTAGKPLHTDFRLDPGGEYLALVRPDGRTIASQFAPTFPPQFADTSFGRTAPVATRNLLTSASLLTRVPSAADPLEPDWFKQTFVPGASWKTGTGLGFGYDINFGGGGGNLARLGTATQSSEIGFPAALALDGDPNTFTHTASDDNQSSWSLDLGREYDLTRIVLFNRTSCCASRLRDITVTLLAPDGTTVRWRSSLLNPENSLDDPAQLVIDLFDLNIGPITARMVRVERTPDPDLSGSNGQGNADEDNVLSLGEVEVYGVESITYADYIRTDLGPEMKGRNATAAARLRFQLEANPPASQLTFRVRYDDGFVTWLNGTQIASANAPAIPVSDSRATAARPDTAAIEFASFSIDPGLLVTGTNVLAIQGLNMAPDDDDFLVDAQLNLEGATANPMAYFEKATPGATNTSAWFLGRVASPKFSIHRGFFADPFDLELTVSTPGATVFYTLDGSEPSTTRGTRYTKPIGITTTTTVRARAFRDGYRSAPAETHTYLFPAATIAQPAAPPGFPPRWANVTGDYAMDPAITKALAYANRMQESLRALPSVCFSTDVDNLFGATRGIYANPESHGVTWERPVSMEWINRDGTSEFQIDAGLRVQGGYFRSRNVTRKHSLRVVFKDEYGPGRLRHDLFGEFGAAREFDTLVLRAGANDGYAWDAARDTEQFIRDEFGRRLLLDMGQPSVRGRFVHVYLNGLYWGIYNLAERPNEDFSSTYLGGAPSDWDSVNAGDVKSGTLDAWNQMLTTMRSPMTPAAYQRLQGRDPAGRRDPTLPVLFDPDNYIAYMLVNIWGGNWDWPNKNFWFGRDRTTNSTGFKFYLWDFENTMGNNRDRSPLNMVSPRPGTETSWVGEPHARLKGFGEYRLRFADHVQRHFFGNGVLTPTSLVERYRRLANDIETAIISETARWGDENYKPPQDLTDWRRERDWLLNTYLPQRTAVVLAQLRAAGLYPALATPAVEPAGGSVSVTTPIVLKTPARALYYTLDGTDPRLPGGTPNPAAIEVKFDGGNPPDPVDPLLVRSDATWKYWDTGAVPAADWNQPGFDDAAWLSGPAQLGYGDGDETTVVRFVDADPAANGVQKNATTLFRTKFNVADPKRFDHFDLEVLYDDAVAVYLNGTEIHRSANLAAGAGFNDYATANASDNFIESRTGLPTSLLRTGQNVIAAEVHQGGASSSDLSFALSLTGVPVDSGNPSGQWNQSAPIRLQAGAVLRARSFNGTDWSALSETRFTIDTQPPTAANLVVSQFAYRPPDATTPAELKITQNREDFEYIELLNISNTTLDLAGIRLSGGVRFQFPPQATLAPGARTLVVANRSAFEARHGVAVAVAGEFAGSLGNGGDIIRVETAAGSVLEEFTYDNKAPWPVDPDDVGFSLVLIRPGSNPSPADPRNWRAGVQRAGTPGADDSSRFTGSLEEDADGNGRLDFVDYALGADQAGDPSGLRATLETIANPNEPAHTQLGFIVQRNLAAEQATTRLERAVSVDGPWVPAEGELEFQGTTLMNGGNAQLRYRLPNPLPGNPAHFFRLVIQPVNR